VTREAVQEKFCGTVSIYSLPLIYLISKVLFSTHYPRDFRIKMLTSQQSIVALVLSVFFHNSVVETSRTAPVGAEVLTVAVIGGY
jgi:hypothetical protein